MERLFPIGRQLSKIFARSIGRVTAMPVPDGDVFDALKRFYDRIDSVRTVLSDPAQTSASASS